MSEPEEDLIDLDELLSSVSMGPKVGPPETPHHKMYREYTEGRYPKISTNISYWLRCELSVLRTMSRSGLYIVKQTPQGRVMPSRLEVARECMRHYFHMIALPRFQSEEAKRRGTEVNMELFLDLVMENDYIKKELEKDAQESK